LQFISIAVHEKGSLLYADNVSLTLVFIVYYLMI